MVIYKVKGYFVTYVHGRTGVMSGLTFRDGSVTQVNESEAEAMLYELKFIPIHEPMNLQVSQLFPGNNHNIAAMVRKHDRTHWFDKCRL
jgi:hypothetical protein